MGSSKKPEAPHCSFCQNKMNVLLFMGTEPDGFVCPECKIYYSPDGRPLARMF